jgi:sugar/nucleoside kinase (ribokinase family)
VILGNGTDRAILTAMGTIADVRAADVPAALLGDGAARHIGSYFLQPGLAAEVPALFRAARATGATTSLDPNWDPSGDWDGGFRAAAAEADVLLPNAAECRALAGVEDLEAAALALASVDGAPRRTVAVKDGSAGGLAVGPDGALAHAAAIAVDAVETTGAGDSFNAGFLHAWLSGSPLADCLRLGVACGSLSTRGLGGTDGQPTRGG